MDCLENGSLATAAGCKDEGDFGFKLIPRFKEEKEPGRLWEIARSTFPTKSINVCEARNEEEFEAWIDEIAQIFAIHGYKMGKEFVIDRIIASLNPHQLDTARDCIIDRDMPIEEFIDKLVRVLYPDSPYIRQCYKTFDDFVERDINKLHSILRKRIEILKRLKTRWNKDPKLSGDMLRLSFQELIGRRKYKRIPSNIREGTIANLSEHIADVFGADESIDSIEVFANRQVSQALVPYYTMRQQRRNDNICVNCRGIGHYANECPSKGETCDNCGRKGHLTSACRTRFEVDAEGRRVLRWNNKPSGIEMKAFVDHTESQRLQAAKATLNKIDRRHQQKLEASRIYRNKKAPPKRPEGSESTARPSPPPKRPSPSAESTAPQGDNSMTDTVNYADVEADCYCHQNKIVDKDVRPKGTSKFVNEDF